MENRDVIDVQDDVVSAEAAPRGSSVGRLLARGGAWAFGGKFGTALSALAINALLARLLPVEEMGAYFIVFTVVTVAALVAQLGLNQTVVKLVAESIGTGRYGRAKKVIWISFALVCTGALATTLILTTGSGNWLALQVFGSPAMAASIGLVALWVFAASVQGIVAESFRGFHDIRLATLFSGLASGVVTVFILLALWLAYGQVHLHDVLFVALVAAFTSLAVGAFLLARKTGRLPADGSEVRLFEVFRMAWPLLVTNLTLYLIYQSDIWILGIFRPKAEVAVYGAAARLMIVVATPLLIVNAVVPPVIAEMYSSGKILALEKTLRATATLAGIPAFFALAGFIAVGGHVLGGVYGSHYVEGALVLAILSLGQLVNVWAGSCGMALMMTGHHIEMMAITVVCGLLTVVGSLLVVSVYGGTGVASVCALMLVIQNATMMFTAKKKVGVWTHMRFSLPNVRSIMAKM